MGNCAVRKLDKGRDLGVLIDSNMEDLLNNVY